MFSKILVNLIALFCGTIILVLVGFADKCHANEAQSKLDVRIYALEYGQSQFRLKDIYSDDHSKDKVNFSWLFYLVKLNNRNILIDTGFNNAEKIKRYNIIHYVDPVKLLSQIQVTPDMITDIILTHSHFDHIGSVHRFKNANIYLQKDEYLYFRRSKKIAKRDTIAFIESNPKVKLLHGDFKLTANLMIEKTGGHTPGSQIIILKTESKTYIFPGDECYFIEGCEKARPCGLVSNKENNILILNKMRALSLDSNVVLLTHHEPQILTNNNKITDQIVRIK